MARSAVPEKAGKPLEYDPNFNGPLKRRSCTDIICLFIFVLFIACWVAIGAYAYVNGNPETLLLPRDSTGARCGLDSHVKDKPYLFFFDLTKCIGPDVPFTGCKTTQICLKECPKDFFTYKFDPQFNFIPNDKRWKCVDDIIPTSNENAKQLIKEGKCADWYLNSKPLLKRCIPDIAFLDKWINEIGKLDPSFNIENVAQDSLKNIEVLAQTEEVGKRIIDDIKYSWKEIIGGILIGICFCLIYIAMLRWIAGVMVWISIIGVLLLLGAAIYFTTVNYKYYVDHPTEHENAQNLIDSYVKSKEFWLVLLIIVAVIFLILFLMVVFLRKRIYLAVALIEEGSKAVSSAISSLVFPIFPWIFQIAIILYTISVALYLSTIGTPFYRLKNFNCKCIGEAADYVDGGECVPEVFEKYCIGCPAECRFAKMDNPPITPYLHAWNIVGFFWGICFMSAFGQMVLAAIFATWYWTRPKKNIPFFNVTAAVFRTLRYHIGTLAFGSLIIAICKMIRAMLEYVDHKLKKYDNEITKAILCCLKCFFWCLEKFLKFINKNAYIMCAIHGKNFCLSAKDAFKLLMRNIIRVFVLDKVTDFLFFMSKLLVTLGSSAIIYTIIYYSTKDNYSYFYIPSIFVAIAMYLISSLFFNVYSMAVDTLFLCYLEDCERNDGSAQKPYYMSKDLGKIFGKVNKKSS